ncbi:hypothetical protein GTY77_02045 [Streptomyces sp. SID8380]|nr:hypothetical protein [Streptomyces sp. SID8380]
MASVDIEGVERMLATIRQKINSGVERMENQGLRAAGEIIATSQREKVAVSTIEHVHIKDTIKVSNVRRGDGMRYVLIGASKETAWRVHFLENGTKRQPAQPFIYPSFHENKARISQFMSIEMRRGMR